MAHKWQGIGEALRLPPPVLDRIKHDEQDCEDRLRLVVTKWLQQCYNTERFGVPSWKLLVDAVAHHRGSNNPALARWIAANHNGKSCTLYTLHLHLIPRARKQYMSIHACKCMLAWWLGFIHALSACDVTALVLV